MHELSIVMSIIDTANIEAAKANVTHFDTIELQIGSQSGILIQALDFAWEEGVKGTVLQNAERIIHNVQAKAKCVDCKHEFICESIYDPCPKCGCDFSDLIQGKEMRISSLSYEEK